MVSNLPTSQLVEKYRTNGDPGLAIEIRKKIGMMPPEEKAVLMAGLKQPAGQAMPEPKTEAFQDGKPVAETISKVPKVEVESAAVNEVREEIAAGVPEKIVKTEQEIAKVVEAVPEVAAEEKEEEKAVQESPVDTSSTASIAESHQKLATGEGDASTAEATQVEEVWSPLDDD